MPFYCLDKNTDNKGRHKMHAYYCSVRPVPSQMIEIGHFFDPKDAFNAAKKMYPSKLLNGCYHCCKACFKD